MSDLIERSEVLKQLRLNHKDVVYIDKKECARRIEAIPSARPKGEWIDRGMRVPSSWVKKCSLCGHETDTWRWCNFCPHCGADMTEREDE